VATRSELRRRRQLRILVVLIAALVLGTFARDVLHAAHDSESARASRNTTFGTLARQLLRESASLDHDTLVTLQGATTLSRGEFVDAWAQLEVRARQVALDAARLRLPPVDGQVNRVLADVMAQRIASWEVIRNAATEPLVVATNESSLTSLTTALAAITRTNEEWRAAHQRLRHKPGRVRLPLREWKLSGNDVPGLIATVVQQVRLRTQATVSINAVSVDPQPLPSSAAQLVLLARDQVSLGVSLRNDSSSATTVTVHLVLTPAQHSGIAVTKSTAVVLPKQSNAAVLFNSVAIRASEHGVLRIWVTGARPSSPGSASRVYTFKVASAG
jgi:hypothetical protein